jgi:threonyl-tRNA synthetase
MPTSAAGSKEDYDEVNAPQILHTSLWETSGHWGWYKENMFSVQCADPEARTRASSR